MSNLEAKPIRAIAAYLGCSTEVQFIQHPTRIVHQTKYFWQKWKPLLGPALTILIMELRTRLVDQALRKGNRRVIETSYAELALALGIDVEELRKALGHPLASRFIFRNRLGESVAEDIGGGVDSASVRWRVALDDPLVPDDAQRLERYLLDY